MSKENELVPTDPVYLGSLALSPETFVDRASKIATVLADVIRRRHLSKKIGPSEHVLVEGWTTLGALVGVSPKEREVKRVLYSDETLEYEAYVDLVRTDTGVVVGGASAICRSDEKNWKDKPHYALRSMAITRATGKAFRLKLAFIMELAGFATTPAEEMDGVVVDAQAKPAANGKPSSDSVTAFWQRCKDLGLSREDGQRALGECGGDFALALSKMDDPDA